MLADHGQVTASSGSLKSDIHLRSEWRASLISFIASLLPIWRDDPSRPPASNEAMLSAQLCGFLNSHARLSTGWDFLQFRREEPDENLRGRAIDLVAAPSGANIWIEGRQYTEYCSLFPIECKRLPTPRGTTRDEREYLISRYSSTGGIQRFKQGHHGASHSYAAMIAYIEKNDIPFWTDQVSRWVAALCKAAEAGWTSNEALVLNHHDVSARSARLRSSHARISGLAPIDIDHLWVEMGV